MSIFDFEQEKWQIDRVPSRNERIVAAISGLAGTIVSLLFSYAMYVSGSADTDGYLPIIGAVFFLFLGVVCIRVAYSAVLTEATKPNRKSQIILFWTLCFVSIGVIPVVLSADNYEFLGAVGMMLSWSIYRLYQFYKGA